MFQSHDAHKIIMKKREFDMAPEKFWMEGLNVGALQSHLLGFQMQLLGTEITRGMGVGKNIWPK